MMAVPAPHVQHGLAVADVHVAQELALPGRGAEEPLHQGVDPRGWPGRPL